MRLRFWFLLSSVLFANNVHAVALTATEIVRQGEEKMRGANSQMIMRMRIVHSDFKRELKLRSWSLGKENSLVEILEPLKEEGVVSLRLKADMWNYLPKTDQVIRVPNSMMLQSWMGSDFTNDDLMKMSSVAEDYTHEVKHKEKVNGEDTVLIQCVPKPNAPVVWGKLNYWARTSDHLPVKEEFYDEKGVKVRTLTLSAFKKMDDRVIPTELKIQKADNPDESTTVLYEKILYNRNLNASVFDKDSIRRTSQTGKNLNQGWVEEPLKGLN